MQALVIMSDRNSSYPYYFDITVVLMALLLASVSLESLIAEKGGQYLQGLGQEHFITLGPKHLIFKSMHFYVTLILSFTVLIFLHSGLIHLVIMLALALLYMKMKGSL